MFLVIEVHLSCFGHLLRLIKVFRKFVLFDLFLLVQTDAGAEEMRAKTKGVKSVYIILTQWPATQDLRPRTWAARDTCISLCTCPAPSAREEQRHGRRASSKG